MSSEIETKRTELLGELGDFADSAQRNSAEVTELLGLQPGDAFIPFNTRLNQPYCVRLLTGDSRRNMIAYGIAVTADGKVSVMVAEAYGSNWRTALTDRMTCWHVGLDSRFKFNPEAVTLHPLEDSKSVCLVELLVRLLRSKRDGEFLLISPATPLRNG